MWHCPSFLTKKYGQEGPKGPSVVSPSWTDGMDVLFGGIHAFCLCLVRLVLKGAHIFL